jgi:DNA-binding PadR family transcriptional regulator
MPNELPKLSEKEFLIMNLLVGSRDRLYGLELVTKSDGALKRGTIYTSLNRLEDKGYIESKRDESTATGLQPRRTYKATGTGVKVFNALRDAGGRAWLKEVLA